MTTLEQQLDTLRTQFAEHSAKRIVEMRQLLGDLRADRTNFEALRLLRAHFHSFAGLGTTYGHPRATELGEAGEGIASNLLRQEEAPADDLIETWQRLVDSLSAEIEYHGHGNARVSS